MTTSVVTAVARLRAVADRARHPACGIASQLLSAGTNVVSAYVASLLLDPAGFGHFVIGFAAVTIVLAAGRGLLGVTLTVHLPSLDEVDRAPVVRSALGFTALIGLGAGALLALGGIAVPVLLAFAVWVPFALLHDVGRYVFFAAGRTGRALALDVAWALVQATVLGVGVLVTGTATVGLLAAAWGLGAAGGLVVFGVLTRAWPAHPGPWARATRDVAGWFTAVAVISQIEVYGVLLLTGVLLTTSDVGGVRAVQLLAFQPPIVLVASLLGLLQPVVVRARHSPAALHRAHRTVTLSVLPVIAGLGLLVLLREPLMSLLFPQYVGFAPLVLPIAVQSCFVALSVGPLTVLNGLRQGPTALRLQALRTLALVAAAAGGMELGGAAGLAWAMALVQALSCAQLTLAARRAITRTAVPADEAQVAMR